VNVKLEIIITVLTGNTKQAYLTQKYNLHVNCNYSNKLTNIKTALKLTKNADEPDGPGLF